MRKNKMMRAASALLVAVLLTTSTISGTFAKYVTQDSAKDVARVAKWGVELQVEGNLYGDTYGADDKIVKDNDDSISVQSVNYAVNTDDVVAPGTLNDEGFSFTLTGKPEVDGEITSVMTFQNIFLKEGTYGLMIKVPANTITEANFDEYADELYTVSGTIYTKVAAWAGNVDYYTLEDEVTLHVDGNNLTNEAAYYPVVYTLSGNTHTTGTTHTEDSLKAVADAVATALGGGTVIDDTLGEATLKYTNVLPFDSNKDLAEFKLDNLEITWAWEFFINNMFDGADTILGNLLAKRNGEDIIVVKLTDAANRIFDATLVEYTDCLDTKFALDVTVAQTDDDSTP